MHKLLLAAMLAMAPAAFAQAPTQNPTTDSVRAERMQQRIARRAERIGIRLGLDAGGVQRIQAELGSIATQRQALRQQLRGAVKTLRAAAQGDAAAQAQVDAAIVQLRSIRQQQAQLREQLFDSLSSGLAPQQKAKLALMTARGHRFGRHGAHRGQRQWRAPGAQP